MSDKIVVFMQLKTQYISLHSIEVVACFLKL